MVQQGIGLVAWCVVTACAVADEPKMCHWSPLGSHGVGVNKGYEVGDTGRFWKPVSNPKLLPPYDTTDWGVSWWVVRVDGSTEMIVRGRLLNDSSITGRTSLEPRWCKPFIVKGLPTKGLKPNRPTDLKGIFKITDIRRSKFGTGFFVFERIQEEDRYWEDQVKKVK